jgi:hypothetical protein
MDKIIDILKDVNNNQLLVLLFSGGIIWTVVANIRSILTSIWDAILACISFTVNSVVVADYDQQILTYKIIKVLSNSKVLWERHTELQPTSSNYNESHLMNSAYGRSYRWLWGHLIILDRNYSMQSTKLVVTVTARVFFARRGAFIKRLMSEIENCSLTKDRDTIMVNMGEGIITEKPKRGIDSVYTDDNVGQRLLSDVKAFLDSKDVYLKNNSPYKFVGLLCGTPGSGKTSTIHAIASELGMGIRFVNTDKEDFESIARIMCRNDDTEMCGKRNIIVIEDIDCMSMNVDDSRSSVRGKRDDGLGFIAIEDDDCDEVVKMKSENNRQLSLQDFKVTQLSLSSILNLLDGIITPNGIIVFLTTNNPEKLDAALMRDGRIDARYDFGNFSGKTANRMLEDHLGFTIKDIRDDITPASLQRDVLKVSIGRMDSKDIVEKYSMPKVESAEA